MFIFPKMLVKSTVWLMRIICYFALPIIEWVQGIENAYKIFLRYES